MMVNVSCTGDVAIDGGKISAVGGKAGPAQREIAADGLLEAIEEIPGTALEEGVTYDWESFPQFLDALERQPRTIDVGAQLGHLPLRVYVMGARAINLEPATAQDIAATPGSEADNYFCDDRYRQVLATLRQRAGDGDQRAQLSGRDSVPR